MSNMVVFLRMQQLSVLLLSTVYTRASVSLPNHTKTLPNPPLSSILDTISESTHVFTSVNQPSITKPATNPFQFQIESIGQPSSSKATRPTSKSITYTSFASTHVPQEVFSQFDDGAHLEEQFWWKIAEAHYAYCIHSCIPFPNVKTFKEHDCFPRCFCDDVCRVYGDCCPDVYARQGYQSPSSGFRCSTTTFGKRLYPVYSTDQERTIYPKYAMMSDCSETAPDDLKASCETNETSHWNLTQPVTDADSLMTYKNRYCAECNQRFSSSRVYDTADENLNLIPWEPSVVIKNSDIIKGAMTSARLYEAVLADSVNHVLYKCPPSVQSNARRCMYIYETWVSRCNESGLWQNYDPDAERACLQLTAPVKAWGILYKNIFCYICDYDNTLTKILMDPKFQHGRDGPTDDKLPLLALLDFTDDKNIGDDNDDHQAKLVPYQDEANFTCNKEHQFYDFSKMSCRSVTCSPGKVVKKRNNMITCHSSPKRTNFYGYKMCFLDLASPAFALETLSLLSRNVFNQKEVNTSLIRVKAAFFSSNETADSTADNTVVLYSFYVVLEQPRDRDETDDALLANFIDFLDFFRIEMKSRHLKLAPTCLADMLPTLKSVQLGQRHVLAPSQFTRGFIYIPFSNTLVCPRVELAWDEIDYDPETNEIILRQDKNDSFDNATNKRIGLPNFYVTGSNTVLVCLSEYKKLKPGSINGVSGIRDPKTYDVREKKQPFKYTHPLYWFALVCTIVSLVFLFISFVVYCLLPSLRNVAGMNNIILIIALFGGQLFLQVAAEVRLRDWLCQAVGVATHFSWLAVIFAQNACTFHMFFTLSFPLASHVAMYDPAAMTRKYTLYVILMSTTFVAATLAWQFGVDRRIGYGGSACYLIGSLVRIFMFAVPLLGTVVFNVGIFVFTIVRLRSLQHVQSTRRNENTLIMYAKLSVFTGLTWLFGFLASLLDSEILSYVFALSHGCQGLFVFLAFLANRRVLGMLRNRLGCVKQEGNELGASTGFNTPTASDITSSTSTLAVAATTTNTYNNE